MRTHLSNYFEARELGIFSCINSKWAVKNGVYLFRALKTPTGLMRSIQRTLSANKP